MHSAEIIVREGCEVAIGFRKKAHRGGDVYMGRHRWSDRLTVEDCSLRLCVAAFRRAGTFACPAGTTSTLKWTDPGDEWLGRLECRIDHSGPTGLAIYIRRQCINITMPVDEQTIPVTTVRPPLGGKRFWFLCACGKGAGRL